MGEMARLIGAVGVDPEPGYLADAAAVVHDTPNRARDEVEWADGVEDEIMARAVTYPFLADYAAV